MKILLIVDLIIGLAQSESLFKHERNHQSSLIVREMRNSVDLQNEVPTDCWVETIENLKQPSNSLAHPSFTMGANFCSSMKSNEKQELALGLTKCHLSFSKKNHLVPENCRLESTPFRAHENVIESCLSSLPQTSFLIYSHFYMHTEMMCMKLTEELRVDKKNDVLNRFEESAKAMGKRFDTMQNRFDESGIVFDRIEQSARMMDVRIGNIAKIEKTIDSKIESFDKKIEGIVGKTMMNSIDQTAKSIFQEVRKSLITINMINMNSSCLFRMKIYGYSGLAHVRNLLIKLQQRGLLTWSTLALFVRLVSVSIAMLFMFASRRFRRCRKFILWMTLAELLVEHIIHYLASIGAIGKSEFDFSVKFMRTIGSLIYILALTAAFISSFVCNKGNDVNSSISPQIPLSTVFHMNVVLEEMQAKFREDRAKFQSDREEMLREREQFRHQMMMLNRRLETSSQRHRRESYDGNNNISHYVTPNSRVIDEEPRVHSSFSPPLLGHLTPRFENVGNQETNTFSLTDTVEANDCPNKAYSIHVETSAFSPIKTSRTNKRKYTGGDVGEISKGKKRRESEETKNEKVQIENVYEEMCTSKNQVVLDTK